MLDSTASPNKMRRLACETILLTQQSQDLLLDPAMVAGPVQDPATVALPPCEAGDAEGHGGRREQQGGGHADDDISSGAPPIAIKSESEDEASPP